MLKCIHKLIKELQKRKGDTNMKQEYLKELQEIEERLFQIIHDSGVEALYSKLGDSWSNLYDYLHDRKE